MSARSSATSASRDGGTRARPARPPLSDLMDDAMRSRAALARFVALAITLVALAGCPRSSGDPAPTKDASGATIDASIVPSDASLDSSVRGALDASVTSHDDGVAPAFADAKLLAAHPIGHTSVVLKVKLEGGLVAAWKPDSRRGKDRYRGEVAARRLARALGLENVPPVTLRAFSRADLLRVADAEGVAILEKEALADAKGNVPGALVPWIAGLTFPALDAEPKRGRWQKVLAGTAAVGAGDEGSVYFADISTLVVFDAISGNWDRWSGGNVGFVPLDKGARRDAHLLFVDNDAAFLAQPPPDGLARNRKLLAATKRFSHSFVERLRALDLESLEGLFGEDLAGGPLLSPLAVAGVRARIAEVKKALDVAGESATNALP